MDIEILKNDTEIAKRENRKEEY